MGGSSTVERCTVQGSRGDGIRAPSSCLILGNTCDGNGSVSGDGAGIHTTGTQNRIEGNHVTNNDRGIDVDSTGSIIIKNTAIGNPTSFAIGSDNRFGPFINISSAANAPFTVTNASSSVSSAIGSTDPWANFFR